jgi:hypothetical protein
MDSLWLAGPTIAQRTTGSGGALSSLAVSGGEKCDLPFWNSLRVEPRFAVRAGEVRVVVSSNRASFFHQPAYTSMVDGLAIPIDHPHLDHGSVPQPYRKLRAPL